MIRLVELLNAFGQWLVAHLGRMSVELAILAVVVLGATWLLRIRSPKFRHLFWCLVLAKPVATFLIASPLSLYWFLRPEPVEPPPPPPAVVSQAPVAYTHLPMMRMPEFPRPTVPMDVPEPEPAWRSIEKAGAASLAWLVIAAVFGVRLVIGCAYVGFLRHSAERQRDGALAGITAEASRALHVRRRVTVALSGVAHGPVLAGVFRPVILIPKMMAGALTDEQLKMIITHEVAHARRWDNFVLLMQRLAEMFLFFHPVVWLCGWIMRREAEAACDDAVVEAYGDWADGRSAAAYADSLTRVAEMKCGLTRRLLVNTFAAAESNFNRRVRRLLTGRAGRMTLGLSALSMAALIVIACLGLPTAAMRKAEDNNMANLDLHWTEPHMDTFAMTMARVASSLGCETDYETMQVLSGEAFAPGIDPTESCPGKWNRRGADLALPFIADVLGLTIEPMPLPPAPGWQGDWDKTREAWAEHRKQVAPQLQQAIDSGAVVLTDGGWEYKPPEFPNVYTFWGVITEARDDGTILGAVFTNDRHDNLISFVQDCWAVTKSKPRITPQETRIEALKLGLARIRQNAEPFLDDERLFGLAAMDAWAERFDHVPFCGDNCGPKAPGCPLSNASTMCEAARNAAAYLRANEEAFHESVGPDLQKAARQYDVIAKSLAPFTKWEGGYEPIMGDVEKQKAHIPVIQSCRGALAMAGDALAAALEAQGVPVADAQAPAKSKGETLMLKDIPLGPAKGNTFASGMASIVKWWGTESDYDTIMGDAGLAFIVQGDANGARIDGALDLGWWPLDPWGDALRVDFLAQTLGHELRFMQADLDEWKADPAAYCQKHWDQDVRTSLERGQAVLAEGATWSLILGMDDGDPPLLGRCAAADKADVTRFDAYPWALVLAGGAKDRLDRREADLQALRHAVALGRDTLSLPDGKSAGQKTYALWAATLRDSNQTGQARWHHNVLGHLHTSRESAVSYLRAMAARHPDEVARHLNAAADRYEALLAELGKADFTGEALISQEGREELALFVEHLAALDARAVDAIAEALQAAGVDGLAKAARSSEGDRVTLAPLLPAGRPDAGLTREQDSRVERAQNLDRDDSQDGLTPPGQRGGNAPVFEWHDLDGDGTAERVPFYPRDASTVGQSDGNAPVYGLYDINGDGVKERVPFYTRGSEPSPAASLREYHLLLWQNILGWSLDECRKGAEQSPEVNELVDLAVSLEPISEDARIIREAMTQLEPADLVYWDRLQGIVKAIANAGLSEGKKSTSSILSPPTYDFRKQHAARCAKVLELWRAGTPLSDASVVEYASLADANQAYGLLGKPTSAKSRLVDLLIAQLKTFHVEGEALEALRADQKLGEFAHRIEMLDPKLWSFDANYDLLLRSIGQEQVIGEWHRPGGPLAWSDGNPKNEVGLEHRITGVRDWLDGKLPSGFPFADELGERDAYKEKDWLVRCLLIYMENHDRNYYNWDKPDYAGAPGVAYPYPEYADPENHTYCWRIERGTPRKLDIISYSVFEGRIGEQDRIGFGRRANTRLYECLVTFKPKQDGAVAVEYSAQQPDSPITRGGSGWTTSAPANTTFRSVGIGAPEDLSLTTYQPLCVGVFENGAGEVVKLSVVAARLASDEEDKLPFSVAPGAETKLAGVRVPVMAVGESKSIEDEGRDPMQKARAVIDGVPRLAWGKGKDNTFAGSLEAATSVTDHPMAYADIMGLTGLAFRVRWSNEDTTTKWCASCAIGEMPDEEAAFSQRTGWALDTDVQFGQESPDRQAIRSKVIAAIDAGNPVAAYGSCLDLGVVYGYEDGGRTLLLSDYNKEETPFRLSIDELGPLQMYLAAYKEPPALRDALLEALTTAVVNWKRERHDGGIPGRDYRYGDAALRAWQHDLVATDGMPEDTLKQFHYLNKWNYTALKDARASAVAFLRQHAPLLGDDARAALLSAATKYQDELDYLNRWEQRAEKPWHSDTPADWTNAVRNSEREALTSIRRTEREAISLIEKALQAEGAEMPAVTASAPAKPSTPINQLESYRWKPMWNSHVASLKAAADEVGVDVSVPWLYGTTGYAFLINVHEAMCPSSWHVVNVPVKERLANVGLEVECLTDPVHTCDRKPEMQQRAWDGVRKAIDAGLPCYGYDLDVGDYYAVYGYDDVGYYYSGPRCVEGKGPFPWQDYGVTNMIGIIYMLSVGKGTPGDDVAVVRDALALALQEAQHADGAGELYKCGLAGYGQWIQSLETGKADGFGTSYNAQSYAESRRNAAEFLKEAKARLANKVDADFGPAIAHYEEVSRNLRIVAETFPFTSFNPEHIKDKERVAKAVEALKAAGAAEEKGLQALAALERALNRARDTKRDNPVSS